jgi:hypothetical protein
MTAVCPVHRGNPQRPDVTSLGSHAARGRVDCLRDCAARLSELRLLCPPRRGRDAVGSSPPGAGQEPVASMSPSPRSDIST